MAEARRQYEDQVRIAQPVVDAQLEAMRQGITQGQDYYDYMVSRQRPVEDALQQQALRDTSAQDAAERAAIAGANDQYAQSVSDIGSQQVASGRSYAQGLQDLMTKYGAGASTLMSQLDDRLAAADRASAGIAAGASGAGNSITGNSAKYEGDISKDIALYTSGNDAIRAKYGTDIENDAALAQADARAGQAQSTNSAIRQAMRYGINADSLLSSTSLGQAQAQAAAANGARTASTDRYRDIVGQGIGLKTNLMGESNRAAIAAAQANLSGASMGLSATGQSINAALARTGIGMDALGTTTNLGGTALGAFKAADDQGFQTQLASAGIKSTTPQLSRDLRINDESRANAKLLDAAGLYRGLTGASQGAYGLAVGAGTAANSNNAQAGNMLLSNMGSANQLQMSGQQLAMQGLGNILNSQTSAYNSSQNSGWLSDLGTIAGAGAKLYMGSERSYKTDIVRVAEDPRGFGWYEFRYLPEFAQKWGAGRHKGVMADEVAKVVPEAVTEDADGHTVVNYSLLC